ncbi:MAG: TlyA family RNA methyltransferase [Desulfobacterales bacterium]|nr:TlyA family RNA methyltransferase [Desulfobacterales bacterium]
MPEKKKRLDVMIVGKGLSKSRQQAQALIMAGKVLVNQQPISKPGALVSVDDIIGIRGGEIPYVSRAGLKLEKALKATGINIENFICMDVGASTGGFTDCLLQHGVKKVYAVDVGYGQLAWKLRTDSRVIVIERTNIRYMSTEAISELVDLVTIDVSFISLKIVVPAVLKFMNKNARILALIKPQFEVGKGKVGKKGVVRDSAQHVLVIENLSDFFIEKGLLPEAVIPSPILGSKGNKEFIISLRAGF